MKNITALLIEDDPEDFRILTRTLKNPSGPAFNFTLLTARDLTAGLAILNDGQVDVVLLDLMLPESTGLDTLRRLKKDCRNVPVVVLTGMDDKALAVQAVRLGAQDYLTKGGFDRPFLERTLRYAIERHRLLTAMETVIEKSLDGMVVIDSNQVLRFSNPAARALLDLKTENMTTDALPFPLPEQGRREFKLRSQSAPERILEVRVSGIDWKDRAARLVSIRDMTDFRQIERLKAEIRERRKITLVKDDFVNNVSHEMRTPLTIIKAIVASLRDGDAGTLSKKQLSQVEMQHRNVLRLQKIVENTLDLSRLESGKAEIRPRPVEPSRLIRETVADFRLLAESGKVRIAVSLPERLPAITADPDLFVHILTNLLDNAMQFAKTEIHVTAFAPTAGEYFELCVTDDGPGIPQAEITDIFNKFVQVKRNARRGAYKGTGLGLAICREMTHRQNGRIWAESTAGEGAVFRLRLPRHKRRSDLPAVKTIS